MIEKSYREKTAAERLYPERPETTRIECPEANTFREARVGQDVQPDGINLQLVKLREKVTNLHEMFSNLEQKTSSICKPMPCKELCATDTPDGSEMQRFLKEQNHRLDGLLDRIAFMCDSIDL